MSTEQKYWFPAKTYGYGWGMPITWQGWLTMAIGLGLLLALGFLFPFATTPYVYVTSVVVIAAAFIGICWYTGEPPRWRWGKK